MFIKSLCLLSSNVWFSGVPDKDKDEDKENNTVEMYVYSSFGMFQNRLLKIQFYYIVYIF
jgi:hypothetical protein